MFITILNHWLDILFLQDNLIFLQDYLIYLLKIYKNIIFKIKHKLKIKFYIKILFYKKKS